MTTKHREKRAFTLVELMVTLIVGTMVVMAIFYISSFVSRQVGIYIERYQMHSQVTYALDSLQVVMPPAIQLKGGPSGPSEVFSSRQEIKKDSPFYFWGEANPYKITPADFTDNAYYTLKLDGKKNLVLEKTTDDGETETDILVDGKYTPSFELKIGDEPNYLIVTLTATSAKNKKALSGLTPTIAHVEGIRLWFVDLIK